MNISEMLSACATIQVNKEDGLPDQICLECSEKTVTMYLFKIKCEKSDIILRKGLEKRGPGSVVINNKCNNIALNRNFIEDSKNDEFKSETADKEMWKKKEEQISYKAWKADSKKKEFDSDIYQIDSLKSQEIVKDIKVEKIEIIEEDIEIKYHSFSPLLMHSKEILFPCPECASSFYEIKNLDEHISELHMKKKPEVSCDETSKRKQQVEETDLLLKNNLHGCDICFEGFSEKSELKEHLKTYTLSSTQMSKQPSISNVVCDKGFRQSYECDICEKKYTNSSNLNYYRRIHAGEKPYESDICKKKYSNSNTLVMHKRLYSGEKPFECEICKKQFSNSSNLRSHNKIHTGEKPYECDVCKRKFARLANLNCHKRIHMGEKPFECKICNRKFRLSSGLKSHKRIHTGEKPYECDLCKTKFSHLGTLVSHKRLHSGEKPIECEICKKKFTNSSNLGKHNKLHTGEKPYKCDVCKKRFITMENLGKHTASRQCL